jgi:hypothetical protein
MPEQYSRPRALVQRTDMESRTCTNPILCSNDCGYIIYEHKITKMMPQITQLFILCKCYNSINNESIKFLQL